MAFITASRPALWRCRPIPLCFGKYVARYRSDEGRPSRNRRLHILHVKARKPFCKVGSSICLPDRGRHRKDRQIHRDYDKSDGDTQEYHHHRLQEGGEIRHGLVHLILIKIGDFPEHAIQRAR